MKAIFQLSILILLSSIIFLECTDAESKTPEQEVSSAKKVETARAKSINYREEVFATGKLASSEEMKLSFKTGGIIRRILVSEGQQVRQGQTLAELDLEEINARTQQATLGVTASEITIKNAELAVERAERELKNVRGLYKDSVATYEQLHDAELQLENAKNQLESAKTGLDVSRQNKNVAGFNLRYSKIVAPSNGTVLKKMNEANELVSPGMPVFIFGSKNKAKVIRVNLTDKDIVFVNLGDEAQVEFDAFPNKKFSGIVTEVASMADPYTNTFEVEIEVDSEGNNLLSGFIGKVQIMTNKEEDLVEIPIDAMVTGNQNSAKIFVIENGVAKQKEIQIYKMEDEKLLINSGLDAGEEVVIRGAGYLENEDSVDVKPLTMNN
jgi:RND family efflux transporter MFP subunit